MSAGSRWHRPADGDAWIMGVLNCTPDSFSDGGRYVDTGAAVAHGLMLRDAGARLIDVGGESTRPGAESVPVQEELRRVIPVIQSLVREGCQVSVDTTKAAVMRLAVEAGATMINDVTALAGDGDALAAAAESGADVCLMHMQGRPRTMQEHPHYDDVVGEVRTFFARRIDACLAAGIREDAIVLDPGIGFGKRLEDNLALIARLPVFRQAFGLPLALGVSRKSFLGALTGAPVEDRETETAAAVSIGVFAGADILRVHDVAIQRRAIRVASALRQACSPDGPVG
jgi:dihydropteroate synthase